MKRLTIALIACLWASLALGQGNNQFGSTWQTPGNQTVGGSMMMCLNANNQAIPCVQQSGVGGLAVVQTSQYPQNAVPITGNAAGTTGAVTGTLAANAIKTTFICGFNVQAIAGTAAVGPITVAGLTGSSQVYQGSSSAAGGTVASQTFSPCIPASATNTAITITTTADGTATAVNVNSWGYQL